MTSCPTSELLKRKSAQLFSFLSFPSRHKAQHCRVRGRRCGLALPLQAY
jgi:hypothetical protein